MSPPVSKYTSIYYVFVLGEGGGGEGDNECKSQIDGKVKYIVNSKIE